MSAQVLTPDEATALENTIDQAYASTPPPASTYYRAAWIILSFSENVFRSAIDAHTFLKLRDILPAELRSGDHLDLKISDQIDRTKFALHQALNLLRNTLKRETDRIDYAIRSGDESTAASTLLFQKAEQYADANRQFPSYHKGFTRAVRHPDGSIEFAEPAQNRPYSMLETLCWGKWERPPDGHQGVRSIDLLIQALNHQGPAKAVADAIAKKTKAVKGKLKYTFITTLVAQLQSLLPQRSWLIPDNWTFSWGTAADTLSLYRALCARSIYHIVAVHFQAGQSALTDNGIHQMCLTLPASTLVEDLVRASGLPPAKAGPIVSALTYGMGMKNPDPALQPIIPVGSGIVAAPAWLIASSNYDRNLFSLHTRLAPRSFNDASAVFETMMTRELEGALRERFPIVKTDFDIPDGREGEQVDILVADPPSRTMLLLELRWMLSPGDLQEVVNRIEACHEKLAQLKRKLKAGRDFLGDLLQKLQLDEPTGWSVSGIVVIDGFGGTPPDPEFGIPLVPQPVLITLLKHLTAPSRLHPLLLSGDWLPREGRDFETHHRSSEALECNIRQTFFQIGPQNYLAQTIPEIAAAG